MGLHGDVGRLRRISGYRRPVRKSVVGAWGAGHVK